jgi:hypothetical protein
MALVGAVSGVDLCGGVRLKRHLALCGQLIARIRDILAPDATKVRKHLTDIASALEPFLDTIGSVSRERVAQCIQAGKLSVEDFAGLYKKEQKSNLVVRIVPTQRTDADYLK